jgi:hypothetical protein
VENRANRCADLRFCESLRRKLTKVGNNRRVLAAKIGLLGVASRRAIFSRYQGAEKC